jgi:hypothetical protein
MQTDVHEGTNDIRFIMISPKIALMISSLEWHSNLCILMISNRLLARKTFGPKRKEVSKSWRLLHKEHDLCMYYLIIVVYLMTLPVTQIIYRVSLEERSIFWEVILSRNCICKCVLLRTVSEIVFCHCSVP